MPRLWIILLVSALLTAAVVFLVPVDDGAAETGNEGGQRQIGTTSAEPKNGPGPGGPPVDLSKLSDASISWEDRVNLCSELLDPGRLSPPDIDRLFTMLWREPEARPEHWFVVANEIMEVMRERGLGAGRYTTELSKIIRNTDLHYVIRDYAVQHLAMWLYPSTPGAPREADQSARMAALGVLSDAVASESASGTSIGGTALLALADVTPRAPESEISRTWDELAPKLSSRLSGKPESMSTSYLVSTVQAVSRVGIRSLHSDVRRLARDSGTSPIVRLSAIAGLGNFGSAADESVLREIAETESSLSNAAIAAIQRINDQ